MHCGISLNGMVCGAGGYDIDNFRAADNINFKFIFKTI